MNGHICATDVLKASGDMPIDLISPAAWSAAFLIDGVVEGLMKECGIERAGDGRGTISSLAKIVQWSIDLHAEVADFNAGDAAKGKTR